ncbi:MAG TPA: membrane dipeptidase [Terriglobales bacterium]|nr:membrane dipeptidase [Terriglobales bacterium]
MITRRSFVSSGLAAAAATTLPDLTAGAKAPSDSSPAEARGVAIDTLVNSGPNFDAKKAIEAGLTGAVIDVAMYPRNFPNAINALADWNAAFRRNPLLMKVLRAGDLMAAKEQKKFGVVLACQDAQILDASTASVNDFNIRNLEFFYDLGIRCLQLTHNERNALGDSFREKSNAGLSYLGENVVAGMNSLGMLIDLSHCGRQTTLEAIRLSKRPCAITHAGCYALCPTARNKSDEEIRALAEKGGVTGIFNMSLWLTKAPTTSINDVVDHIDHVVKVAGIDHVSFGSDGPVLKSDLPDETALQGMQSYYKRNVGLPGAEWLPMHVNVKELNGPERLARLADALSKRGYNADAIDKVVGANFARLFRDVCG